MSSPRIRDFRIQNPKILDSVWIVKARKTKGLRLISEPSRILDLDSGFWKKHEVFCGSQSQFQNPSEYLPLKGERATPALTLGEPSLPCLSTPSGQITHQLCSFNTEAIMPELSSTKTQTDPCVGSLKILALDLGTKTGWAVCLPDRTITSGTAEFKNDRWQGGGMRFLRFKQWLTEIKQMASGLDAVFIEEVRRHAGVDAAHAYGGFLAHVTAWCEHHTIPYEAVPVGTIKRHATGKGNANKEAMILAARKRGFNPADDNEADALAILDWAMTHRDWGGNQ